MVDWRDTVLIAPPPFWALQGVNFFLLNTMQLQIQKVQKQVKLGGMVQKYAKKMKSDKTKNLLFFSETDLWVLSI